MYCTKVQINEKISVDLFAPDIFRVRKSLIANDEKYNVPFAVGHTDDWESVEYTTKTLEDKIVINTELLKIVIEQSGEFSVFAEDEQLYPSDKIAQGLIKNKSMVFDSAAEVNERNKNSRYAHWFYNYETCRYDIFLKEDVIYDVYFVYGKTYKDLYKNFNTLTGPVPMLPRKMYGFMQTEHPSKGGTQDAFMNLAKQLRERKIPCDVLILDFEWGDTFDDDGNQIEKWGSKMDWSKKYAEPLTPPQMVKALKDDNFDMILNMHSAPEFKDRLTLGLTEIPHVLDGYPWPVEEWTKNTYEFMDWGIKGIWSDLRHQDVTFAYIWSILRDHNPRERVWFIQCYEMFHTQSWNGHHKPIPNTKLMGWHRYPISWTGDMAYSWTELKYQIKAISNIHGPLKGVSYVTGDGYGKNGAVQARWLQFMCFTPVVKNHMQRPWTPIPHVTKEHFAVLSDIEETAELAVTNMPGNSEDIIREIINIRYSLIPYIYSLAYEYTTTGMPMMIPLMIEFENDKHCNKNQWQREYLFGKNLLVAPVYSDARTMEIYLPANETWIDFFDGTVYEGGQILDYDVTDLSKMPLFIRGGSILVTMDRCQYLTPGRPEKLYVDIYVKESGEFTVYEDDGNTTDYEKGIFSKTYISYKETENEIEVVIKEENNCFEDDNRTYEVRLHNTDKPLKLIK